MMMFLFPWRLGYNYSYYISFFPRWDIDIYIYIHSFPGEYYGFLGVYNYLVILFCFVGDLFYGFFLPGVRHHEKSHHLVGLFVFIFVQPPSNESYG